MTVITVPHAFSYIELSLSRTLRKCAVCAPSRIWVVSIHLRAAKQCHCERSEAISELGDCWWDGHLARHSESTGETPVPPITPRNDNPTPRVTERLPWTLVVVLAVLLAPPVKADPMPKVCVQDDLSRQVCVSAFPKRVISLAPSLTEMVFDLGAGHTLVGRTARCNQPPEALKIPEIGAYMSPDLERIIALKPDLVLSPKTGIRREVVDRLTEIGISTLVDNSNTLDDIVHSIRRLGKILGRESDAETVVRKFQQRRQAVRKRVEHAGKPLILFAVGIRPLVLAGGRSFIGSLIREAGGVNVAEEAAIPHPKFSMEEVAKRDPDIIIVLNKECRDDECFKEWQRHRDLRAVKNKQIYQLDADLIARPAPRITEALEQLAAIFHPKVFAGGFPVDVNKIK